MRGDAPREEPRIGKPVRLSLICVSESDLPNMLLSPATKEGLNHTTMLSASMDNADKNRSNEKLESVLVREVSDVCTDRSSFDISRVVLQADSIAIENTNRNTACFIC